MAELKHDFTQMAHDLAQTLSAAAPDNIKITLPPKSYKITSKDEKYQGLKHGKETLIKAFGIYDTIATHTGERTALTTMLDKMVIPLKDKNPAAFAAGLDHMKNYANIFPDEQHQKAWRDTINHLRSGTPTAP